MAPPVSQLVRNSTPPVKLGKSLSIQKRLPLGRTSTQLFTHHFSNTHFSNLLPFSHPRLTIPKKSLIFRVLRLEFYMHFSTTHACYMFPSTFLLFASSQMLIHISSASWVWLLQQEIWPALVWKETDICIKLLNKFQYGLCPATAWTLYSVALRIVVSSASLTLSPMFVLVLLVTGWWVSARANLGFRNQQRTSDDSILLHCFICEIGLLSAFHVTWIQPTVSSAHINLLMGTWFISEATVLILKLVAILNEIKC